MKKALVVSLMFFLVLSFVSVVSAQSTKPVELKAIAAHAVNNSTTVLFLKWVDKVNKAAQGKLSIKFIGGPESIPDRQQGEALSKGIVHIGSSTCGLVSPLVKEVSAIYISAKNSKTLREAGFLTELDKYFMKANLHYLLFHGDGDGYYVFAGRPIAKPQDLKGLMMRSTATYDAMFKALGCSPVSIPAGDVYSAMERHIVDGFAYPLSPLPSTGLIEVTKTFIDHMVLGGGSIMFMNLDAWKGLPPDVQKIITDINLSMEDEVLNFWKDLEVETRAALKAKKVDFVKFSNEDAKWYTETARKASQDALVKQAPDTAPGLMKLIGY